MVYGLALVQVKRQAHSHDLNCDLFLTVFMCITSIQLVFLLIIKMDITASIHSICKWLITNYKAKPADS